MAIKDLMNTLADAGISITEASKILPVSRATLHNWKSHTTQGDPLRLQLVASYTKLIKRAVESKRLPLSGDVIHKERVSAIRRVLSDVKNNA